MPFAKNKNALSDAKMKEMEEAVRNFDFSKFKKSKGAKFTTDSKGNTTKNYRFGGKVVQKMESGGEKLSQKELEEAIRQIGEQGNVFGKGESLSPSQTKKIADKFEADFTKMFGKKYGGAIRKMRGGGLMEAIKKVQAKEMKAGGDVEKPKAKPKNFKKIVQKQKRDRAIADGDMTIGDFNEMTPSMMQDFYKNASKVKEMELGGEAVPSKFKGFSKLPEGVQQKIDPKLASKYEMGGKVEKYGGGGKVKGGKMSCRGMGAAVKGGGYTIS